MLRWRDGGKKLICNSCNNLKDYTPENFQITEKTQAKTCRWCRNIRSANKRRLLHNTGKYYKWSILDMQRPIRRKVRKILRGDKIMVYKTIDGLKRGQWMEKTGKKGSAFYRLYNKLGKT